MLMTATTTQTLVINPAFLQEIKDSNPDLWQAVHALRQTCEADDDRAPIAKRLVRQLDDLRDALAFQFALEESYGFIVVPAVAESQRLVPAAAESQRLVSAGEAHAQHYSLYLRLSELAERAEELQYRGMAVSRLEELVAAARAFDTALRDHERLEAELIERAYEVSLRR